MPSQLLAESRKTLKRHAFSSPESHQRDATIIAFPAANSPEYRENQGQRYGEGGTKWGTLGAILIIHVLLIGALLTAKMVIERKAPAPELKTFALASDPLPPEAQPAPMEPSQITQPVETITSPPPLVQTPSASPIHAPPPPSPVAVAAPVAQAPAAVRPAPPAPVTPPDFSAGQLKNPGPAYPFMSRRAKEQGVVTLRVLVTEEGRAGEVRVENSSGFDRLDRAALDTVKRWKFLPAKQAGKAIAAWVLVPITFALGQ